MLQHAKTPARAGTQAQDTRNCKDRCPVKRDFLRGVSCTMSIRVVFLLRRRPSAGPMYFVFLRLFLFSPPATIGAVSPVRACLIAYPYDRRGFVGPKKTIVGLYASSYLILSGPPFPLSSLKAAGRPGPRTDRCLSGRTDTFHPSNCSTTVPAPF